MALLAHTTGASGLATLTITGATGLGIRIYGIMGSTQDDAGMVRVPAITITNVRDDAGGTFTARVAAPEGGAIPTLNRAINFVYGPEYEFVISKGASTVLAYDSGTNTSTPDIMAWYNKI